MPVAVPIAVGLAAGAALLIALAMQQGYRFTFYELLIEFADRLDRISVGTRLGSLRLFGALAARIRWLAVKIDEGFSAVVIAFEAPFVWLLNQVSRVFENTGRELGALAEDVAAALDRLRRIGIPAAITAATFPLLLPLKALQASVRLMSSTVIPALHRAFTATADRVGRLERAGRTNVRRLTRLEKLSLGLAASGVALWALSRAGLGWIRCRNVGRAGKRICRMDYSLLDSLISDTLVLAGGLSLVALAEGMLELEDELVELVTRGFSEFHEG